MATKALKVYVKGKPEEQRLGDCPFCHRTLLTLELKGLDYTKEYIDFKNKPKWVFEKSKEGTMPILQDGDEWIPDSGAICEYLESKYPPSMGPCSAPVAEKLFPSFVQFLKASDADAPEMEAALLEQLQELDDYLAKHGPFLNGASMGASDAQVVPRLYHIESALPHFRHYQLPDKFSNVWKYLARAKETDAFKHTDYGKDMLINGWREHGVKEPRKA